MLMKYVCCLFFNVRSLYLLLKMSMNVNEDRIHSFINRHKCNAPLYMRQSFNSKSYQEKIFSILSSFHFTFPDDVLFLMLLYYGAGNFGEWVNVGLSNTCKFENMDVMKCS